MYIFCQYTYVYKCILGQVLALLVNKPTEQDSKQPAKEIYKEKKLILGVPFVFGSLNRNTVGKGRGERERKGWFKLKFFKLNLLPLF